MLARWGRLAIGIVAGAVALLVLIDAARRAQAALRVLADSGSNFPERLERQAELNALDVIGLAVGSVATLLMVASAGLLGSAIRAWRRERPGGRRADLTRAAADPARPTGLW